MSQINYPFRKRSFPAVDKTGHLLCPLCYAHNLHFHAVEILLGHYRILCVENVPFVHRICEPRDRRGSQITTWYWCESGHTFATTQRFHKGEIETDVFHTPLLAAPGSAFPSELWRN